jgi:saccharopine dehydrogenase-like NADP-dependent oxidoreductase
MVRIALAGGSGGVGREIMDALLATGKHEITIISRKVTKWYEVLREVLMSR